MGRQKTEIPKDTSTLFSGVNIDSSTAIYVQIENLILFGITAGHLGPDAKIPSILELSERFEVNPNTIAKSYRGLEVKGILYARRGMGVYITKNAKQLCSEHCREQLITHIYEVMQEARYAGMAKTEVMNIVKECIKSGVGPYSEESRELLKSIKSK
jgi:GntR family transcriptional regulator